MRSTAQQILGRLVAPSVLAAVVVAFVRCGSTDNSESEPFVNAADGGGGGDTEKTDNSDGGLGLPQPRVLVVVHAAEIFDFRVCFATSTTSAGSIDDVMPGAPLPDDARHPMPQANYPGVARGNAALVEPTLEGGDGFIIPFLVSAFALTDAKHQNRTCAQLLSCGSGSSCLEETSELVRLPGLAGRSLVGDGSRLLAVTGAGSQLAMRVVPVSGAASRAPFIGGQLTHLAPTLPGLVATYGAPDGGAPLGTALFGETGTAKLSLARPNDTTGMQDYGALGVSLALAPGPGSDASADAGGGSIAPFFFSSLASIQQASDPSVVPSELFKPGASYAFVVLGDPSAKPTLADGGPNPDFAGQRLHVIAVRASAALDAGGGI